MLNIIVSSAFKEDRRLCVKRGYNMGLLATVIDTLATPAPLPPVNKDHGLSGNWAGFQECHIQSDWLLIYRIDGSDLYLTRTGTHSDLLGV